MRYAIQSHGVRDGKKFTNRDPQTYATREDAQAELDEREAEGSNNPGSEIVEVDEAVTVESEIARLSAASPEFAAAYEAERRALGGS